MKKIIGSTIVLLFACLLGLSFQKKGKKEIIVVEEQEKPNQNGKRMFPAIIVKENGKSSPLGLDDLKVEVKVVGNMATTTFEMTFYNDLDRVLEGELYFPLGEGKTVSRFALDLDGKLREGVVVEKAKGRKVFESVIRQNIDPGLLEWTKGNNFKARVYPIPAKGTKKLVFAYEQELSTLNNETIYTLPLGINQLVKSFNLKVQVLSPQEKPILKENELANFKFKKWGNQFIAEQNIKNYTPKEQIGFVIPNTKSTRVYTETINNLTYFYTNLNPKIESRKKQETKAATIVWDASGSAFKRDISKEHQIISSYLSKLNEASIEVIVFSNSVINRQKFNSNDYFKIINFIKSFEFDGGTQLGCLDFKSLKSDEILLFSDGISNFGSSKIKLSNQPIHCVNTSNSSDFSYLKYLSSTTGGNFYNTKHTSVNNIIKGLNTKAYKLIGMNVKSGKVTEVYPKTALISHEGIQLAGKISGTNAVVTLKYGFGNQVYKTEDITISSDGKSGNLIKRIWAQKKLSHLDILPNQNKNKIIKLAKEHQLVSRFTSLIVLDRIEDYVTHEITPPIELIKEYTKRINNIKSAKQKISQQHIDKVINDFEQRYKWWQKDVNHQLLTEERKRNEKARRQRELQQNSNGYAADTIAVRTQSSGALRELANVVVSEESVSENQNNFEVDATENLTFAFVPARSKDKSESKSDNSTFKVDQGEIQVNSWNSSADYITVLKAIEINQQWKSYLALKRKYINTPAFYVDVAAYFYKSKRKELALRVLSNLAELELENVQLLRILAYKLQDFNEQKLAIHTLQEVLEMKEEEPHSYRDLGLAYKENGEYQKAVETLYKVVTNSWDNRFPGIETIVLGEINAIAGKHPNSVSLKFMNQALVKNMPMDVRVVLNWDTDNCDMDLWVTDPFQEKCYYSRKNTKLGGYMSNDFTRGYGPEEFLLKKGYPGKFKIQANYYGTRSQKLLTPVSLKLQFFTQFGKPNEQVKEVTIRLEEKSSVVDIAEIMFNN